MVRKRNALLAMAAVTRDMLKPRPENNGRAKIKRAWETDARLKLVAPFIESWNYWRDFYVKERPAFQWTWEPRTAGQATCIEHITELAREHALDLDLLIACFHRQWGWKKTTPLLTMCLSHALDYYNDHIDAVHVDLDAAESTKRANDWDDE